MSREAYLDSKVLQRLSEEVRGDFELGFSAGDKNKKNESIVEG